jgi:hypothetical protein
MYRKPAGGAGGLEAGRVRIDDEGDAKVAMKVACLCIVLIVGASGLMRISSAEKAQQHFGLPQGAGLAARYPADRGIEKDPAVILHEDFESGSLKQWDEPNCPVAITTEARYSGSRCVEMAMHRGTDTGTHLIKWFSPGADTVYVRFYVKFSWDYQYDHHFVTLLANPPGDRWRGQNDVKIHCIWLQHYGYDEGEPRRPTLEDVLPSLRVCAQINIIGAR